MRYEDVCLRSVRGWVQWWHAMVVLIAWRGGVWARRVWLVNVVGVGGAWTRGGWVAWEVAYVAYVDLCWVAQGGSSNSVIVV